MISEDYLKEKLEARKLNANRQRQELADSLKYASYIQSALLPDISLINRLFPENFILFKPKDIVSGDFYWAAKNRNFLIIAAADCTGHGIPGAFMSVMAISFLNEIAVKGDIFSANSILNQLRERVMKALHQSSESSGPKDGLDISLCLIDTNERELQFAGANNPLYIVRKGKLIEIKGDRMPIGISAIQERSFKNHNLKLENNDVIYLFSDGFPDQFGGEHEKKFKYQPFKNLLVNIYMEPLDKQKDILYKSFNDWKGDLEQIDDVLIMGVRYIAG